MREAIAALGSIPCTRLQQELGVEERRIHLHDLSPLRTIRVM